MNRHTLVHHERRREHEAADQRDIQIEREALPDLRQDERLARRQYAHRRPEDEIAETIHEEECDAHPGDDGETRSNQTRAQFVEVLQKPHRAAECVAVCVVV